jgi:predicted transcriptional regulator
MTAPPNNIYDLLIIAECPASSISASIFRMIKSSIINKTYTGLSIRGGTRYLYPPNMVFDTS